MPTQIRCLKSQVWHGARNVRRHRGQLKIVRVPDVFSHHGVPIPILLVCAEQPPGTGRRGRASSGTWLARNNGRLTGKSRR